MPDKGANSFPFPDGIYLSLTIAVADYLVPIHEYRFTKAGLLEGHCSGALADHFAEFFKPNELHGKFVLDMVTRCGVAYQ